MDQWWERHNEVAMEGYERSEVEDFTGCIPLLLDRCVVGGKIDLNEANLRDIYAKSLGFGTRIRNSTWEIPQKWNMYVRLVRRSGTLLTFQVLRIHEGLLRSLHCTICILLDPRPDRPSVFLSSARQRTWKLYVRFNSRRC